MSYGAAAALQQAIFPRLDRLPALAGVASWMPYPRATDAGPSC